MSGEVIGFRLFRATGLAIFKVQFNLSFHSKFSLSTFSLSTFSLSTFSLSTFSLWSDSGSIREIFIG